MIRFRNMLKRVGESRHSCRTPTVVSELVSYAAVQEDCTSGLVIEVLMTRIRLVLMFLSNFSQRIRRLKISVVLLPAVKPSCFLAVIFSSCGFSLFSMILSMALLG